MKDVREAIAGWRRGSAGLLAAALLCSACSRDVTGPLPGRFVSVAVGLIHSCGVVEGGAVYCWGNNEFGQLGDGTLAVRETPVVVVGSVRFASVAPGGGHTCGLTEQGKAYCWGFNLNGQLGDGTVASKATPTAVDPARTYRMLAAGSSYTCGISADSTAYCWGWNQYGQLGDGSLTDRHEPVPVAGGLKFIRLGAGSFHTCGVAADGKGYCWGANAFGQLGTGDTAAAVPVPREVRGSLRFLEVDAGFDHTCGRATDGSVYCWGRNQWGQLGGPDSLAGSKVLVPALVTGGIVWSALAVGSNFNCGIEEVTEAAYCWGYNGWGQLGASVPDRCVDQNGQVLQCSPKPYPVSGNLVFAAVSAGNQHACGLSVEGVAYCWGLNEDGQLGNGQRAPGAFSLRPVQVARQP
jgi:alpha-tubulin suppressor-like RCC1 family protein